MSDENAKALVSKLRRELGLAEVRVIDIEQLLLDMGTLVLDEEPMGGTAEAMSLDFKGHDVIFAPAHGHERRRRFTLGHELGHLLLGHGGAPCSASDIHGRPKSPQEREANVFSSRLLLPSPLFRQDIRRVRPRFAELTRVADLYETSMTATAIRYVEETEDPCALVGVTNGGMDTWVMKSDSVAWWVKDELSPDTLVSKRLKSASDEDVHDTPADAWLDDFTWRDTWNVREEVFQVWEDQWLVLVSEIPDREDDPDYIERGIDEELDRRRNQFRLH